jgi:orotate phosphoribosyltransferase
MPDTTAAAKRRLIAIVRARSFSTGGETKLVSGRSTSFYFDMKPSMLHPEGAQLMAQLILDALEDAKVDLVGGMEIGAVPLAAAVAALSQVRGRPLQAFFVRKQPKEHGARKLVEGLAPGESLQAKRVAILEDVTTTGGSSMKAIEALRAEGALIDRVITIVDRLEGAAQTFQAAAIPFTAILTAADFR